MRRKVKPQISFTFSARFESVTTMLASIVQGDYIYERNALNSDGEPKRWKITSIKTWKKNPNAVLIGVKSGLTTFNKIHSLDEFNQYFAVSYETIEQSVLV